MPRRFGLSGFNSTSRKLAPRASRVAEDVHFALTLNERKVAATNKSCVFNRLSLLAADVPLVYCIAISKEDLGGDIFQPLYAGGLDEVQRYPSQTSVRAMVTAALPSAKAHYVRACSSRPHI